MAKEIISVLEFIFSSFWIWLGTLMMLSVVFAPIGAGIASLRNRK